MRARRDGDTAALNRVDRIHQLHAPTFVPAVPIEQEAGWAPELVWTVRRRDESLAPAGNPAVISRLSSPLPGNYCEYAMGKIAEVIRVLRVPAEF